ncbi:hypothetical protein ACSBR1_018846 [Camellia fascicularis]
MFIATPLASLLLLVPLRHCCDFASPNWHLNSRPSIMPLTTLFHVGVVGVCADFDEPPMCKVQDKATGALGSYVKGVCRRGCNRKTYVDAN